MRSIKMRSNVMRSINMRNINTRSKNTRDMKNAIRACLKVLQGTYQNAGLL